MLPPDSQLATKDKAAPITELKRVDAVHDRLLLEHSDLRENRRSASIRQWKPAFAALRLPLLSLWNNHSWGTGDHQDAS